VARKPVSHTNAPYEASQGLGAGSVIPRLIVVITCIAAIGAMVYRLREPTASAAAEPPAPTAQAPVSTVSGEPEDNPPDASPLPTARPEPTPTPMPLQTLSAPTVEPSSEPLRIGIVAGHWGHDTGAVCDDGLQEVDVNLAIAVKLVQILKSLGYEVDLLEEFDLRLRGYSASVLISIHADSCQPFPNADPPMSGYKIASVEDSWVPDEEQRLLTCLADRYAELTGMFYHANTVTYDMTRYHTFYEVDGYTPSVIFETGFMYADRHVVAEQPDLVAQAIAEGILCYLASDDET
jgi:N-acetylmuramoyl-L-alanine amidase